MRSRRALTFILTFQLWNGVGCSKVSRSEVPKDVVEIINAIDTEDETGLRTLLENGAIPTPAGSPLSPIHAAITHFDHGKLVCNIKALQLLLDHGANPNFIDRDSGFAPLEDALSMGEMGCIRLLRTAGASVDTHGDSMQSLMQFAVKGVVRTGDVSLLQLVNSWGVSVDAVMGDGRAFTALHEAAWITSPKMADSVVAELLRLGADPCVRDKGQTPLDIAQNLKRSSIVQTRLKSAMTNCWSYRK